MRRLAARHALPPLAPRACDGADAAPGRRGQSSLRLACDPPPGYAAMLPGADL